MAQRVMQQHVSRTIIIFRLCGNNSPAKDFSFAASWQLTTAPLEIAFWRSAAAQTPCIYNNDFIIFELKQKEFVYLAKRCENMLIIRLQLALSDKTVVH